MFQNLKFPVNKLISEMKDIVTRSGKRIPLEVMLATLRARAKGADKYPDLRKVEDQDAIALIHGLVVASKHLDIRRGRTGGIGLTSWVPKRTPVPPISALTKRIRELGASPKVARQGVQAYAGDLVNERTKHLSDQQIFKLYCNI